MDRRSCDPRDGWDQGLDQSPPARSLKGVPLPAIAAGTAAAPPPPPPRSEPQASQALRTKLPRAALVAADAAAAAATEAGGDSSGGSGQYDSPVNCAVASLMPCTAVGYDQDAVVGAAAPALGE